MWLAEHGGDCREFQPDRAVGVGRGEPGDLLLHGGKVFLVPPGTKVDLTVQPKPLSEKDTLGLALEAGTPVTTAKDQPAGPK